MSNNKAYATYHPNPVPKMDRVTGYPVALDKHGRPRKRAGSSPDGRYGKKITTEYGHTVNAESPLYWPWVAMVPMAVLLAVLGLVFFPVLLMIPVLPFVAAKQTAGIIKSRNIINNLDNKESI